MKRLPLDSDERALVAHVRRQYSRKGFVCLVHPHHENNPATACRWMHPTKIGTPQ